MAPHRRLIAWIASFPRGIWLLTLATLVESTGRFMVVPYLSLYLNRSGVSLGVIGLILGAAPAASLLFGALGGHLSDRWGRKPVQVIGVASSGAALLGFAFAGTDPLLLGFLNFLNGMTRTLYRPATSAALADLSPPGLRSETFALQRTAINAAFGWGPLLGVLVFSASPRAGFLAGGALNLAVGLFIALALPETAPRALARAGRSGAGGPARGPAFAGSPGAASATAGTSSAGAEGGLGGWKRVLADGDFLLWSLGLALLWGAYDLIQSFLPIHLARRGLPLELYGAILSVNALVCVFGQIPVSRAHREARVGRVALLSKLLFVLGFLGFAWFSSPLLLLLAMLVLSVGEIVGSAVQVRFIPERAPPELLGRYLGLSVFQELGKVFVAPAAGFLMERSGGASVFAGAALLSLGGGLLLWRAARPRDASSLPVAGLTAE